MGSAMARIVFDVPRPTVGLLNVGVEEIKGIEEVKAASRLLRQTPLVCLDYYGFVEGDDIGKGTVDVVVTEGFSGNIALKTAEGTAKQISQYLREAISDSWLSRLGYLLARAGLRKAAGEARSAQCQWRRVPRTRWRGDQESWRFGCVGNGAGDRNRLCHGSP